MPRVRRQNQHRGARQKNMTSLRPIEHKIWRTIYRISALALIFCLVPIVSFPYTVGYSWAYWVALGAAVICGTSAAVLKRLDGEEASDEAAWLLGKRGHGSKSPLDIDDDN